MWRIPRYVAESLEPYEAMRTSGIFAKIALRGAWLGGISLGKISRNLKMKSLRESALVSSVLGENLYAESTHFTQDSGIRQAHLPLSWKFKENLMFLARIKDIIRFHTNFTQIRI